MHWFLKMFKWYRKQHGGLWYCILDHKTGWKEWHHIENLPPFDPYSKTVTDEERYSE